MINDLDHGKLKTYKKLCRCEECKAANSAYQRDYQARRKTGDIKRKGASYEKQKQAQVD